MDLFENRDVKKDVYLSAYIHDSSELNSIKNKLKELSYVDNIDPLLLYLVYGAEQSTEIIHHIFGVNYVHKENYAKIVVEGDAKLRPKELGPRTWNSFMDFWKNGSAVEIDNGRPYIDESMVWFWDCNRSDEENLAAAKEWFKELESIDDYADKFSQRHDICYQIYEKVFAWRKKENYYGCIFLIANLQIANPFLSIERISSYKMSQFLHI